MNKFKQLTQLIARDKIDVSPYSLDDLDLYCANDSNDTNVGDETIDAMITFANAMFNDMNYDDNYTIDTIYYYYDDFVNLQLRYILNQTQG